MQETLKKLTKQIKEEIKKHLETEEVQDFIQKTKAAEDTGSFEVIISTADIDRQGEIIDQNGWDLSFYKLNPVVLWAHDYYSLPIGVTTDIKVEDGKLIAKGTFAPEEANPFAQQVRRLYDLKIVRATSVGFIPLETDGQKITRAELLEFSFVPVPANPYALSLRQAAELGLNTTMLAMKGIKFIEEKEQKSVVPFEETPKAPEDREWDGSQAELSIRKWASSDGSGDPDTIDWEKYRRGFAWYDSENKETFAAYKLPHHEVIDGELKVVWSGVAAAMAALQGARGGVDIPEDEWDGVYNHLAKHYLQFDKEPPEKIAKEEQPQPPAEPNPEETPQEPEGEEPKLEAKIGVELSLLQNEIDDAIVRHSKSIIDILKAETGQAMIDKIGKDEQSKKTSVASTQKGQGFAAEESRDGGTPKQRSNSAGFDAKDLNEWLAVRQVLRIINNITSDSLKKFNERAAKGLKRKI
jgi:hypothetical protein